MMTALFKGQVIFIDNTGFKFKDKTYLKQLIVEGGGQVSFSLNKKVSCVISSNVLNFKSSSRGDTCKKLHIPVVTQQYVSDTVARQTQLAFSDYEVLSAQEKTDTGRFELELGGEEGEEERVGKERMQEISKTGVVGAVDVSGMIKLKRCPLNMTELWVKLPEQFVVLKRGKHKCQYWKLSKLVEALALYRALTYLSYKNAHIAHVMFSEDGEPFKIERGAVGPEVQPHKMKVFSLVQHLWDQAGEALNGEHWQTSLTKVDLTVAQVVRLESIVEDMIALHKAGESLSDLDIELRKFCEESKINTFYTLSIGSCVQLLDRFRILKDRIPLSQGIKTAQDIYGALGCKLDLCPPHKPEVGTAMFNIEQLGCETCYYSVNHPSSVVQHLKHPGSSTSVLYHATATSNMWGVLARGLVMPWQVVNELGIIRRDHGRLGRGVYFSEDPMDSIRYLHPETPSPRGTMFLIVCEVVTGNPFCTTREMAASVAPPHGFDSVVSVPQSQDSASVFKYSETCIFDTSRVKIAGLIEFSICPLYNFAYPPVKYMDFKLDDMQYMLDTGEEEDSGAAPSIEDILQDTVVKKVDVGLLAGGSPLPLKTVNVAATITDMVGQVTVLQSYHSNCEKEREAKYVFPLDEGCAVCGFEAYIGDKHIVGELKKKEEARKQYRDAVKAGHGAYLMEQEEPDLFSISIGNIPSGDIAIHIKIIYVTELTVRDNDIIFKVAALLNSNNSALDKMTQLTTTTDYVSARLTQFTITANITMPFKILEVFSCTHPIRTKVTDTTAMVRWTADYMLQDFEVHLVVAEVNRPRMWVERQGKSEAAMLTFYPDISVTATRSRLKIVVDCSKSMSDKWKDTQKQAMLLVSLLPDNCKFNISSVGVGDGVECFPDYKVPSDSNKKEAIFFIQKILKPAEDCCEVWEIIFREYVLNKESSEITNLVLLSGGVVTQPDLTLTLASSLPSNVRVFTILTREAGNKHYLQALAKQGGGAYDFLNGKEKGKWKNKVHDLYDKCGEPALDQVQLKWNMYNSGDSTSQAPLLISSLFNKHRQIVYGYTPHCRSASLVAHLGDQYLDTLVSVEELQVKEGTLLHKLTAKALIEDYVNGVMDEDQRLHESQSRKRKEEIVSLSLEHSVISPFTSFVAVEEREKGEVTQKTVDVQELLTDMSEDLLPYMEYSQGDGVMKLQTDHSKRILLGADSEDEDISELDLSSDKSSDPEDSDSEDSDDEAGVVVDMGAFRIRAGFAGDDAPRSCFPPIVGRPKYKGVMVGMGLRDIFVGDEAVCKAGVLLKKNPLAGQDSKVDISNLTRHRDKIIEDSKPKSFICTIGSDLGMDSSRFSTPQAISNMDSDGEVADKCHKAAADSSSSSDSSSDSHDVGRRSSPVNVDLNISPSKEPSLSDVDVKEPAMEITCYGEPADKHHKTDSSSSSDSSSEVTDACHKSDSSSTSDFSGEVAGKCHKSVSSSTSDSSDKPVDKHHKTDSSSSSDSSSESHDVGGRPFPANIDLNIEPSKEPSLSDVDVKEPDIKICLGNTDSDGEVADKRHKTDSSSSSDSSSDSHDVGRRSSPVNVDLNIASSRDCYNSDYREPKPPRVPGPPSRPPPVSAPLPRAPFPLQLKAQYAAAGYVPPLPPRVPGPPSRPPPVSAPRAPPPRGFAPPVPPLLGSAPPAPTPRLRSKAGGPPPQAIKAVKAVSASDELLGQLLGSSGKSLKKAASNVPESYAEQPLPRMKQSLGCLRSNMLLDDDSSDGSDDSWMEDMVIGSAGPPASSPPTRSAPFTGDIFDNYSVDGQERFRSIHVARYPPLKKETIKPTMNAPMGMPQMHPIAHDELMGMPASVPDMAMESACAPKSKKCKKKARGPVHIKEAAVHIKEAAPMSMAMRDEYDPTIEDSYREYAPTIDTYSSLAMQEFIDSSLSSSGERFRSLHMKLEETKLQMMANIDKQVTRSDCLDELDVQHKCAAQFAAPSAAKRRVDDSGVSSGSDDESNVWCRTDLDKVKLELEAGLRHHCGEEEYSSKWYENMMASLKFPEFISLLTNYPGKCACPTERASNEIINNAKRVVDMIRAYSPKAGDVFTFFCSQRFQDTVEEFLEGDDVYPYASQLLLKSGLKSLGLQVVQEVFCYLKLLFCMIRIIRVVNSLEENDRKEECDEITKIAEIVLDIEFGDKKNDNTEQEFRFLYVVPAVYRSIFLIKYAGLPRQLEVAWDWNSFFTMFLYSFVKVEDKSSSDQAFARVKEVFDEDEDSFMAQGKKVLEKAKLDKSKLFGF